MKKGILIFWGIIIAVIVLAFVSSFMVSARPGPHNAIAQCIKNRGVIFYGAYWCPHCQRTKALFGSSAKLLPYVECSTANGRGQTQICIDKKVQSYPTWTRPDGAILTGEHTLEEWAGFSGCTLDGQEAEFTTVNSATSSEITTVPQA